MSPELANIISAPILFFLLFGLGALATAVTMVLYPNPVRAALFLVLNLFCVAVLYLLLNAYFLAGVQVIVYAGAIMVLFLFVIMLLNLGTPDRSVDRLQWQQPAALVVGVVLVAVVAGAIASSVPAVPTGYSSAVAIGAPEVTASASAAALAADPNAPVLPAQPITPDNMGTVENVGRTLYHPDQPWLFPFEITSILLLIAVIGSVVLAQHRTRIDTAEESIS
jgi:NADH-quinone oxidoreductase subunit J